MNDTKSNIKVSAHFSVYIFVINLKRKKAYVRKFKKKEKQ